MLAPHGDDASVLAAIEAWLSVSVGRDRALSIVLDGAERRDLAHLGPIVVESLRALQSQAPGPESERLLLRGARVLRLTALEEDVLAILDGGARGCFLASKPWSSSAARTRDCSSTSPSRASPGDGRAALGPMRLNLSGLSTKNSPANGRLWP